MYKKVSTAQIGFYITRRICASKGFQQYLEFLETKGA